ncbi:MAG: sulfite reductase, assimilatory-type [Desulfotalea sp.]|nr:MAG: sulfite reductase, assimilatory-type [Desulfotalea sp.]
MPVIPPKNAILQRDKKTYAIVPRIPGGLLQRDHLAAISMVTEKYNIPIVKITSGQRIALVGVEEKDLDAIYEDLGMDPGHATELCLHYVQACPGTQVCQFGVQDSLGFGIQIEQILANIDLPAKFKIGVSGCQFCCAESFVRDIGLIGKKNGWTVIFGGNAGNRPRIGDIIGTDLASEEVLELLKRCLDYYSANGKKKERAARFIQRIGIEEFKQHVL